MIIVGWGHRRDHVLGPVEKMVCPRCQREDFWELVRLGYWATLFFIPVIPYKSEYVLRCPICCAMTAVPAEEVPRRQQQAEALMRQLKGAP